ncbi:MAG: hypothetical protein PHC50_00580 [Candidatus Cloacimonetes bacterium]|nr:hypothetical protein [Candidatus Cloacimonadota bacterium]
MTKLSAVLIKMYIFNISFLDGYTGQLLAKNSAWSIGYKYKK